jgi:hypothetical protein
MAPDIPIIWSQHGSDEEHVPIPGMYNPSAWSESEKEIFLVGLYIFGKRLNLMRRFLEGDNKTTKDVLSYYYGNFYKTDRYKKYKMKHRVVRHRLFQGWRQDQILSCLTESMPKECHDTLKEVLFFLHVIKMSSYLLSLFVSTYIIITANGYTISC